MKEKTQCMVALDGVPSHKPKGKFIVIEGIDGCGKTTQVESVVKALTSRWISAVEMSNVSTSPIGIAIRKVLDDPQYVVSSRQLACIFASELFITNEVIRKTLESGTWVVCSRWHYSTLAYAGSKKENYDLIEHIYRDNILNPDVLIYLDIKPDDAIKRIDSRDVGRDIYENVKKQYNVYAMYEKILADENIISKNTLVSVLEATNDAENITNEIMTILDNLKDS